MKAHEMFSQMSAALAVDIISFFYQTDRNVYKTAVSTLATQRKLRPVFVTKKSRDAQFDWIVKSLQARRSDEIAQHLLQAWLMKAKSELLIEFLEELGIEHDGTGAVEELPKALDAGKLKLAIGAVLGEVSSRGGSPLSQYVPAAGRKWLAGTRRGARERPAASSWCSARDFGR